MEPACRFDDSVPRMLRLLASALGVTAVENGVILRDASGYLTFFTDAQIPAEDLQEISAELLTALGPYAHPSLVLATTDDPGTATALSHPDLQPLEAQGIAVRYLDRRIVGADWLYVPPRLEAEQEVLQVPPARRIAFTSLKGGVGRSTALTVIAAEQARMGRNVLVIDLDLEAPGIGSLLLSSDRLPAYGVIDYLVERNFGPVDRAFVQEMVGTSALTQGQGLVDVAPAVGTRSLEHPQNYLAKLSRAMIEAVSEEGNSISLAGKLAGMLRDLEAIRRYDLVLLDVRAGLAELTAGPLLYFGAEVLIFATAQEQSVQDLSFLFAHLGILAVAGNRLSERLKMVHAKASSSERAEQFRDQLWELFAEHLYEEAEGLEEFNFDADDPAAPHYPLTIPLDTAFADWDPVRSPDKLVESFYARTFAALNAYIEDLLTVERDDGEE
jgi:cellulose biosynthesis protein BcsQ